MSVAFYIAAGFAYLGWLAFWLVIFRLAAS